MTHVETTRTGDVATISFSGERGINVFSSDVLDALRENVESLSGDRDLRFVVLRGRGRTFVAGANIKEMIDLDPDGARAFAEKGRGVFDMIESLPQITVAAINGHALGGGCELTLACDFRIMAARATIGQPETHLGLIPGWGGTERLPRLICPGPAKRLMFGGEAISADRARQIGLVDEVVDGDEGLDQALTCLYASLRNGAPGAIARIKRVLRDGGETDQFAACFADAESREGMGAFIDKRPASWMNEYARHA